MKSTSLLALTLGLGATAVPTAAWACDPALTFGNTWPPSGTLDVPAYSLAVVEVPGFAGANLQADLLDARAGTVERLEVYPVGPDHVVVPLQELNDFIDYRLTLRALEWNQSTSIDFQSTGAFDERPPPQPQRLSLRAERVLGDPCLGTGWTLEARFLPSVDDLGLSAYFLAELLDDGDSRPVGGALAPQGFEPEGVGITAFTSEGGYRCFSVLAVDYGGNPSDFEDARPVCVDLRTPPTEDGGMPPPIDGGLWDSGRRDGGPNPPPDAGPVAPRPDAGALAGLGATEDVGCGCASARVDGSAPWLGIGGLLALGLTRRRRAPHTR